MDSARNYLINSVTDRCLAFSDYIEPLKRRQYASEFPPILLKVLDNVNKAIGEKLRDLSSSVDFQSLEDEEVEQHILRYSQLHSYLQEVVSFVERTDVPHTVVELIQPLKRLMMPELKEFELILHPLPVLNYNIYPLGAELSTVIEQLGLSDLLTDFPKQLVTIGFPSLERENFLIHSLIGHDIMLLCIKCHFRRHNGTMMPNHLLLPENELREYKDANILIHSRRSNARREVEEEYKRKLGSIDSQYFEELMQLREKYKLSTSEFYAPLYSFPRPLRTLDAFAYIIDKEN